ncbi:type VI secretion protein [Shewanella sp. Isolate13]|uniref:type VI secretion protein n=1 Tax=Shewanella sp. Isolate13 TaxID=2908531 RepID=UPI001EFD0AC6|nr:type VI secretion protein [Shewanella sp. Isolate13]MCG9730330.1 type VI secretion protein [Shewanella sp. Isolate13]
MKAQLLILTTASLMLSSSAYASIETQLAKCASIEDKLERLICYDNLAQSLQPNSTVTKPLPATETVTVATSSTAVVSTTGSSQDEFGKVKKSEDEEINKIYLNVSKVSKDAYGALKIQFTNGQVWKQTDGRSYRLKADQTVYIEKAALGSFMLGLDDRNTTIRVKRLK